MCVCVCVCVCVYVLKEMKKDSKPTAAKHAARSTQHTAHSSVSAVSPANVSLAMTEILLPQKDLHQVSIVHTQQRKRADASVECSRVHSTHAHTRMHAHTHTHIHTHTHTHEDGTAVYSVSSLPREVKPVAARFGAAPRRLPPQFLGSRHRHKDQRSRPWIETTRQRVRHEWS